MLRHVPSVPWCLLFVCLFAAGGARWTEITANAPWAGRYGHTTVIDSKGTIYVMGGRSGSTYLNDVWQSKDGGEAALMCVCVCARA